MRVFKYIPMFEYTYIGMCIFINTFIEVYIHEDTSHSRTLSRKYTYIHKYICRKRERDKNFYLVAYSSN